MANHGTPGERDMQEGEPRCPRCGAEQTVPILYCYPTPETVAAVERGEIPGVAIGGCVIEESNPSWACPDCKHRW
jgi:DNA-directed RNA polymerase subunit RPC12/RpoP